MNKESLSGETGKLIVTYIYICVCVCVCACVYVCVVYCFFKFVFNLYFYDHLTITANSYTGFELNLYLC